jgi:hypothetical protein
MANLVLLCRRHHWSVHEGGWQISRGGDGTLLTTPPLREPVQKAREPAFVWI